MVKLKFVDVETPYMGSNENEVKRNLLYARACVRDCIINHNEIPFASHLFFTQPGILDDNILSERELGINIGKELIESLPEITTVVYTDLEISRGMKIGIDRANLNRRNVVYRKLGADWELKEIDVAIKHSHAAVWGVIKPKGLYTSDI